MKTLLFIDDYYIKKAVKVRRKQNTPKKLVGNPVLSATESWESMLCIYGSVLKDNNIFKAYYTNWWMNDKAPYSCKAEALGYAVSEDGIKWQKPNLGIIKNINNGNNNLIRYGKFADQPCVVKLKEPLKGNKYAMAYYGNFPPLGKGVYICFSKNGINWNWPSNLVWKTLIDGMEKRIDYYAADDTINFYYDNKKKRFIILRKIMQEEELAYDLQKHNNWVPEEEKLERIIAQCESQDLVKWENHKIILTPSIDDDFDTDFHRFSCTPFNDHYIGMLEIHHKDPRRRTIDIELLYSRDGYIWERPFKKQSFIPNGDKDDWDRGVIFVPPNFITNNKDIFFYYGGMKANLTDEAIGKCKNSGIGIAKIPKDRFSCLWFSNFEVGFFKTVPIEIFNRIGINATIESGGMLKIGLCDGSGKFVHGFDLDNCDCLEGDIFNKKVTWNNKNIPKAGKYSIYIQARSTNLFALYIE